MEEQKKKSLLPGLIVNQSWKPFCQKCDIHTSQRQTEITIHKTPHISSSTHKINTAGCCIFHQIIQFTPEGKLKSKYSELSLSYNSWGSKNWKVQEAKLVSDQITSLVEQSHTSHRQDASGCIPTQCPFSQYHITHDCSSVYKHHYKLSSLFCYLLVFFPSWMWILVYLWFVGVFFSDHSFSFSKLPWALIFLFSVFLERLWI